MSFLRAAAPNPAVRLSPRAFSRKLRLNTCPVHEFRDECWEGCGPERYDASRLAIDYWRFWQERARGVLPLHQRRRQQQEAVAARRRNKQHQEVAA